MVLLFSGSACKFPCVSSVFYCQMTLSPLLLFFSCSSPWADFTRASLRNMLKHFSSEGCHQNVSVTESFWCVKVFHCWNILLMLFELCSPCARPPPSISSTTEQRCCDWYIFFSFYLSPISRAEGRLFCATMRPLEWLEIHLNLLPQWNSLWLYIHTTHQLKPSEMMLSHIIYPPKSCLTSEVIDYILREEDKRKMSHWDYCDF